MTDKAFLWDDEKNRKLKKERGIAFEDIVLAIGSDCLLDIIYHPNKSIYPNQKVFILAINNYAYLVPFVENEHMIFLKTIIPSRKATKKYLKQVIG